MEQRHTSPEDAQLAIKILKHALEYRPTIRPGVTGAAFLSLTKEERLNETLTPRMTLGYADEDKTIPILFFRFVGDEAPVIEAVFYPYEAILTFLDEARGFVQWAYPADTKETVKEHRVFESTVDMTLIMLDHFYQRAELMMDSFVWEVI